MSSTSVDASADATYCTTGGWRDLHPQKSTYSNTSSTARRYEIYDGYFWNVSSSPGTSISTPLTNFVRSSDKRVLVRTFIADTASRSYNLDYVQLEVGIDPIYEPGDITINAGNATSGYVSDLIGTNTTGVTPDDSTPLTIQMPSSGNAADVAFTFKNVRSTMIDDFIISNRICVSNTGLNFKYGIYNNDDGS